MVDTLGLTDSTLLQNITITAGTAGAMTGLKLLLGGVYCIEQLPCPILAGNYLHITQMRVLSACLKELYVGIQCNT